MSDVAAFLDSTVGIITAVTFLGGLLFGAIRWLYYVSKKVQDIYGQVVSSEKGSLSQQIEELSFLMQVEVSARRFYWSHDKEALFECDVDGRCIWANRRLCDLFGLDGQEVLGNGWLTAIAHEDREETWENWIGAVKARVPYEAQYTLRHPQSRNEKEVNAVATCCYIDGKQARYFGVVRQIMTPGPLAVA